MFCYRIVAYRMVAGGLSAPGAHRLVVVHYESARDGVRLGAWNCR